MRYKLYNRYSVYLRDSEMPVVICGTVHECAKAMGIAVGTFYSYLARLDAGKPYPKKYIIYKDERETEEVTEKKKRIPEIFQRVILALAENDMRSTKAAMQLKMSLNGLSYNIQMIIEDTGKDPMKFYDLCELVQMVKAERGG